MTAKMIANAITTVLALSVANAVLADNSQTTMNMANNVNNMEKCYGVVKSAMNDCSNGIHSCAGEAKIDSDPKEWVFVPNGLCKKIKGGSLKA